MDNFISTTASCIMSYRACIFFASTNLVVIRAELVNLKMVSSLRRCYSWLIKPIVTGDVAKAGCKLHNLRLARFGSQNQGLV